MFSTFVKLLYWYFFVIFDQIRINIQNIGTFEHRITDDLLRNLLVSMAITDVNIHGIPVLFTSRCIIIRKSQKFI